jgi:Domain of unknown function (DUF5666)
MRMQMAAPRLTTFLKIALGLGLLFPAAGVIVSGVGLCAQTTAQTTAPAAAAPKLGTVKAVSGSTVTLVTDAPASETVTITVLDGAKVQQLAVGSTDLKTATPAQISDIAVGDRVLAAVKPGTDAGSFAASRVILMKSGDIAQKNAAEQAAWKTNGTGGIVASVDAASGAITISSGAKKVVVQTSSKTEFRRFAGDSVKFQDAKPGTLAEVQPGDQVQARGTKSADGLSVQADEVVSGSFENLSGVVTSLDAAAGKITLRDLATKKAMTVNVTANADIRKMPAQMAAMFATRANGGGGGGRRGGGGGAAATDGGQDASGAGARRSAAADLSQMIGRMPASTLGDLKVGDAVMVVASEPTPGATTVTAITLLSGVEPILTANPNGGMDLSMSLGGGGGGGGDQ